VGLTLFAVVWSLANMLHALAGGWEGLMACRILLGASEAAIFPAGLKAVREWFPARERSVATGWFNVGSSVGAMVAQPLVVWCILVQGWQTAFIVTGAIGLVWAGAWCWLYRRPSDSISVTPAELAYIRAGQEQPTFGKSSIRSILGKRNFLGLAIARFFAEPAWQTFSFWIPLYLSTVRHMNLYQLAAFAWLPFLSADLGAVAGGYLAPLFVRRGDVSLLNSRKWVAACGTALMIGPASIGLTSGAPEAVALFCIGGFAHQMISGALYTASADLFDDHEVATACGLIGTAGYAGGLMFSLMIGKVAPLIGYNPLFLCLFLFDVIGVTTMAWLVRPRSSRAAR
jgi:ACS family hexuronate transporter-like MFS transporter